MSHDRGCWRCGVDLFYYDTCRIHNCPKKGLWNKTINTGNTQGIVITGGGENYNMPDNYETITKKIKDAIEVLNTQSLKKHKEIDGIQKAIITLESILESLK